MNVSMDLLTHIKTELEKTKKIKDKFKETLEKIANGYDDKALPVPKVLEKEDMVKLAIHILSTSK